ncbi:AAA family ATPase [Gemmatimonadota bacterium]
MLETVFGFVMTFSPQESGYHSTRNAPVLLKDLFNNPDLFKPPVHVADRFAFEGRVTLLAAREKTGKSTIASFITACVSRGRPFIGSPIKQGVVLYISLEENRGELCRRLKDFDANPGTIYILDRIENPFGDLAWAAEEIRPALIVIDSLPALVCSKNPESGSAADWTPIMQEITQVARRSESAILLLHHASKSTGHYRDSTAIGAGVDLIIEMHEKGNNSRRFECKGRWDTKNFDLEYNDENKNELYTLRQEDLPLEQRVILVICNNPGCTKQFVYDRVTGKTQIKQKLIDSLLIEGTIEDRSERNNTSALFISQNTTHRTELGQDETSPAPSSPANNRGNAEGITQGKPLGLVVFPDPNPNKGSGIRPPAAASQETLF